MDIVADQAFATRTSELFSLRPSMIAPRPALNHFTLKFPLAGCVHPVCLYRCEKRLAVPFKLDIADA